MTNKGRRKLENISSGLGSLSLLETVGVKVTKLTGNLCYHSVLRFKLDPS